MEIQQHLVFSVVEEVFSVNVEAVKSIVKMPKVYKVPQAPDYILGIINVEGEVIPLLDAGKKFSNTQIPAHDKSQVIILRNDSGMDKSVKELAFLVTDVLDVDNVDPMNMQKLPTSKYHFDERFVDGVNTINKTLCMQINIQNLFEDELDEIVNTINQ